MKQKIEVVRTKKLAANLAANSSVVTSLEQADEMFNGLLNEVSARKAYTLKTKWLVEKRSGLGNVIEAFLNGRTLGKDLLLRTF